MMDLIFPHEEIRPSQKELVEDVIEAIRTHSHLIAHAPTGLGKTAATLSPALAYALKNGLNVFFLTSRHTQHRIALDTLKQIKKKHNLDFGAVSIVGKKWMCLHPGVEMLSSGEFSEFCRALREDGKCDYYSKTKTKEGEKTVRAKKVVEDLLKISPLHSEEIKEYVTEEGLCPYEIAAFVASQSKVVVTDYYYVLHPSISDSFLQRTKMDLAKSIVIIDEGHNIPSRIRELASAQLSDVTIKYAIKEAERFSIDDSVLHELLAVFEQLGRNVSDERLVKKEEFFQAVAAIKDYDLIISELEDAADAVLEKQKRSSLASVASFLQAWKGEDGGFARILTRNDGRANITLSYRCLDPSLITEPVIKAAHSVIIMSGTLTPTAMYKELLGFPKGTKEREYPSPFPVKNRLALVVPRTTTKFSQRSPEQFRNIAEHAAKVVEAVPGNVAVFFPSYALLNEISQFLSPMTKKPVFTEDPSMTKEQKQELLDRFKKYEKTGAVLLGVASGSFGEGIDLPGDLLKGVVVVGLPLGKPDLETKELIEYYNRKFGKGWDYGYVLPAFTKTLQNAGRCIRTETDRGVVVFLDERYAWPMYIKCFSEEWDLKIKVDCEGTIREFFQEKS